MALSTAWSSARAWWFGMVFSQVGWSFVGTGSVVLRGTGAVAAELGEQIAVGLDARGVPDAVEQFALERQKLRRMFHVPGALARQRHLVDAVDAAGPWRHQHHPVAQVNRLLDIVRDENDGALFEPVHMQDQVVHHFAGLRIE